MNDIQIKPHPPHDTPDRLYIFDKAHFQNIITFDYVNDEKWQLYLWKMMFPDMHGYDSDSNQALIIIGVDLI